MLFVALIKPLTPPWQCIGALLAVDGQRDTFARYPQPTTSGLLHPEQRLSVQQATSKNNEKKRKNSAFINQIGR